MSRGWPYNGPMKGEWTVREEIGMGVANPDSLLRLKLRRFPLIENNSLKDIDAMRGHISSGRKVTINRIDLIEKLRSNRATHAQIYEEALIGYRKKILERIEFAKTFLADLAAEVEDNEPGKQVDLSKAIKQPHFPLNELEAYDDAIELFETDTLTMVELDVGEFRCFWQDKWDWQDRFLTSNALYSGTAAAALD